MSFLDDLNPVQREAVLATDGPVMIIAGAGSGKSRVLTYRVAYLISRGVRPESILALTFTNKAAEEMKSRIVDLVGMESRNVWMGTFHSVFARILRFEAERIQCKALVTSHAFHSHRMPLSSPVSGHGSYSVLATDWRQAGCEGELLAVDQRGRSDPGAATPISPADPAR